MSYPETPYRLRRVNGYFPSWMKTAERVELAKRQAPERFIAELSSLTILTASVAFTAKKLHEAAHAELIMQCEDLNAIKKELQPGPEVSAEDLLSEVGADYERRPH
jgi:hypothetical protein